MPSFTRRKLFATVAAATATTAFSPLLGQGARAAAPAASKQNAGWYRYKVGDFEVTVVTDGQGSNPLSDKYVTNEPKDAVEKDLAAQFLPKDKVIHTYTPVVINTGSKLVAIDT